MALWETQDPYPSHESEPFTHSQLNMTRSVVKQRRRGTSRTATTRSVERTKIVQSSTSTFDNRIIRFGHGPKVYPPFHCPPSITYHTSHTEGQKVRPRSG